VVESRGAPALKGIERPLQLYRVIQPSGVRGRLEGAAAARGLTPFVGREDELRLLMNRWENAQDGEGQVALIIGEAGMGKSRLVRVDFAFDVTLNRDQMITAAFAGDLFQEHATACASARNTVMRAVDAPFDVVVTTNSGYRGIRISIKP
jgi:hypothetical protein